MNEFNLEYQYQFYLKMVELDENKMAEVQKTETRRAFMAACGIMLTLLRDNVSNLEESDAIEVLQGMEDQVLKYFENEANRI